MFFIIFSGPTQNPVLHPVQLNTFPRLIMVKVLSHIPGSVENCTCYLLSNCKWKYTSSDCTNTFGCLLRIFAIRSYSSLLKTFPVGLWGVFKINILVLGVKAFSNASKSIFQLPFYKMRFTHLGFAPTSKASIY